MLLNYTNTGNSDIDAPLIIISSPTETGVAMREGIYSDHSIALMGLAMDGPPNIIRPGQVGEFPLQFVMDSHDVTFHADVVETSDTRPLDRSLLDSLRPAGVEVVQWSGAVELLLAKIDGQGSVSGPTLGEFARMLGATADRLFELEGRRVRDASTLLEFELRELLGLNTGSISGQLIDADTKQPLAEVTMFASRLSHDGEHMGELYVAQTDATGRFVVSNLADATYVVYASGYYIASDAVIALSIENNHPNMVVEGRETLQVPQVPQPVVFDPTAVTGLKGGDYIPLADFAYLDSDFVDDIVAPAGYRLVATSRDNSTGFFVAFLEKVVADGEDGELVVAFRGSEGEGFIGKLASIDWWANMSLAAPQWDRNAENVFGMIDGYLNENQDCRAVSFVGHSLGGGLAQYAAYDFVLENRGFPNLNVNLFTINGVGVVDAINRRTLPYSPSVAAKLNSVEHFSGNGDLVSLLGGGHVGGELSTNYLFGDKEVAYWTAHEMSWVDANLQKKKSTVWNPIISTL